MSSAPFQLEVALDGSSIVRQNNMRWQAPTAVSSGSRSTCADLGCFADLVQTRADPMRTIVLAMTKCAAARAHS